MKSGQSSQFNIRGFQEHAMVFRIILHSKMTQMPGVF